MKKCNGWMNHAAFADVTKMSLSEEEKNSDTLENEIAT